MGWSGYHSQLCVGMHKHLHLIRYTGVCVVRIHCEMNNHSDSCSHKGACKNFSKELFGTLCPFVVEMMISVEESL